MGAPKGVKHRKPNAEECEKIQNVVIRLLGFGKQRTEIKNAIAAKYGLRPRSVERYLCQAKELMLAETGKSGNEHRADGYYFYLSIVRDENQSTKDRLKARERIDKLLGLELQQSEAMEQGTTINVSWDSLIDGTKKLPSNIIEV